MNRRMVSLSSIFLKTCAVVLVAFSVTAHAAEKPQSSKNTLDAKDVKRFSSVIVHIQKYYVKDVESQALMENAIRGIVSGLDPHSAYLDEQAYKELMQSTSGEFSGLGIEIVSEGGLIKIVTPLDDTPASKAGLESGDYILAINGAPVSEMTLTDAVRKMRGKVGASVVLTIVRQGKKQPFDVKIVREKIKIQSVKSKVLENGFGYIRLSQFQDPTAKKLRAAVKSLEKESHGKLRGLVLDLRNNPGGLLESAVDVADAFLNHQDTDEHDRKIVYTKGRTEDSNYMGHVKTPDILDGKPLIVLINNGSASASEIVAGALQDYKRAVIMGEPSFGKGSVQSIIPISQTQAIKLTTALYYTPAGREIQAHGIYPDILVEDLKLSKKNGDEAVVFQPLKESRYKRHLKGKNEDKAMITKNQSELAQDDYVLFEALNLLKAMDALNRSIAKD
ncbi:MAG: S41 family peptidase [Gammaproteobacteria bacterium]